MQIVRKIAYAVPGLIPLYHFLMSWEADRRYGHPSGKLKVIGVTGTKGKSTAIELTHHILTAAGRKTALLSSVFEKIGNNSKRNETGNSMPGRFAIQKFLKEAADAGCEFAVLEVTSEGVRQFRHRRIKWFAAALTNIEKEHIESHGSFEKYRAAKLAFLRYAALQGAPIFINRDDGNSKFFQKNLSGNLRFFSRNDDIYSREGFFAPQFNQENEALAVALAGYCQIPTAEVQKAVCSFHALPGRFEYICRTPVPVVVDYAHTPDSLQKLYVSIKELHPGIKLVCVLGSAGGRRDKWKRPVLGEITARECETVILTNEDPYDENPREIISEIENGFEKAYEQAAPAMKKYEIELDRRRAIERALELASRAHAVIITGKGSETVIHVGGGKTVPWNDAAVVREILQKRGYNS